MPRTSNAKTKIGDQSDGPALLSPEHQAALDRSAGRLAHLRCVKLSEVRRIAVDPALRDPEAFPFGGVVTAMEAIEITVDPASGHKQKVQRPVVSDGTGKVVLGTVQSPGVRIGEVVSFTALVTDRDQGNNAIDAWRPSYVSRITVIAAGDDEDAIDFSSEFQGQRVDGWTASTPTTTSRTYRPPEFLTGSDGTSLLYRGMRHLVSGPPEVGKTWLAAAAAAQVLQRREAAVVWFDCDAMGQAPLIERLLALGASLDAIKARLRYVRTPAATLEESRNAVGRIAWDLAPALVVWDGWNAALAVTGTGLDEAGVVVWRDAFLEPFHRQRPGCISIITDHVARGSSSSDIYSYGAQGKLAQMDVHLRVLQRRNTMFTRQRAGEIAVTVMKDRPGGLSRDGFRMPVTPDDGLVDWDIVAGARMTPDEREAQMVESIMATLGAQGPMTTRQVEDAVDGRREAIREALTVLEASGRLRSEPGPRGAKVWRVEG